MNRKLVAPAMIAALAALAFASPASAQGCTFSGDGTSGSSGVDCYGQTWNLASGGWGIPGIFFGDIPFAGPTGVNSFTITFTAYGTFDGLIGFGDGLNESPFNTRFGTTPYNSSDFWDVTGSGNSVTFTAQPGNELVSGESFFVNVEFLNGLPTDLDHFSFQAEWGASDVVPEPATMTLLATGLAGMAAARRKKRQA